MPNYSNMPNFAEQMETLHDTLRRCVGGTSIEPLSTWELKDYIELHSYIKVGYLVQDDWRAGTFNINPEWEWDEDIDEQQYSGYLSLIDT
tara:strand:+ start:123 stop:392 length:270 start_codon:yes stop_codon:yes gene_type:complete